MLRKYRTLTRVDFDAGRPLGETDNTEEQRKALDQFARHHDELYDHREDPTEAHDLAAIDTARAESLRNQGRTFLESRPNLPGLTPAGSSPELEHLDAETRERLRAIGYVE